MGMVIAVGISNDGELDVDVTLCWLGKWKEPSLLWKILVN